MPPDVPVIPCPDLIISDTHIGHPAMLAWYAWRRDGLGLPAPPRDDRGRPRPSPAHMEIHDDRIVAAWREVVSPDASVLHMGDVVWNREAADRCLHRMRGRVRVVKGNHDRTNLLRPWATVSSAACFMLPDGRRCLARHRPSSFTAADADGYDLLFHGHLHDRPSHAPHPGEPGPLPSVLPKLVHACMDRHLRWSPMPIGQVVDASAAHRSATHPGVDPHGQAPRP